MASNAFDTTNPGSAVSNREDLQAGFYLISPEEYPVTSSLAKKRATAVNHEWTADKLNTPALGATREGADATSFDDKGANRVRVGNLVQVFQETAAVSDVQERVDNAAVPNEMAHAIKRALLELNLNVEATAISEQVRADDGAGLRTAAGFGNILDGSDSSVFSAAAGAAAYQTPSDSVVASGSPTERAVNGVLRSIFNERGRVKNLKLFADSKWLNDFTEEATRLASTPQNNKLNVNIDGKSHKVDMKVRMYEGPHGMIEVHDLNPATSAVTRSQLDRAFFIDTDNAYLAEFAPKQVRPDDAGGGPRAVFKRYVTFCVGNGKAHGYWKSI